MNNSNKVQEFEKLLKKSLEKMPKEHLALAFSGGIDSSVLARLMKSLEIPFTAYVVSIKKSKDLEFARKIAKEINFKLVEIIVDEEDVEKAQKIEEELLKDIGGNIVSVAFNIPIYFVSKFAKEKNIVIAQGPDPLLGGYKRYSKMKKEKAEAEMKRETELFFNLDFRQNNKTAEYFKKNLIMPYIDKEIIDFCQKLEYEDKINSGINKHILRQLALKLGIKKEFAMREKQACQYGSGIIKMLIKITKKNKKLINC